eukprot:8965979-Lingulodinium_polyedra.AAC.1
MSGIAIFGPLGRASMMACADEAPRKRSSMHLNFKAIKSCGGNVMRAKRAVSLLPPLKTSSVTTPKDVL